MFSANHILDRIYALELLMVDHWCHCMIQISSHKQNTRLEVYLNQRRKPSFRITTFIVDKSSVACASNAQNKIDNRRNGMNVKVWMLYSLCGEQHYLFLVLISALIQNPFTTPRKLFLLIVKRSKASCRCIHVLTSVSNDMVIRKWQDGTQRNMSKYNSVFGLVQPTCTIPLLTTVENEISKFRICDYESISDFHTDLLGVCGR